MGQPEQERTFSASVVVARPPEVVYDLVSDVTRMGRWSPVCRECWWDEPEAGAVVGAGFTGRNVTPERTWETRSRVTLADRPRAFGYEVADGWVRWEYVLEPVEAGTRLTETWTFLARGLAGFRERYGDDAERQIRLRTEAAHDGIPRTLEALRADAESSAG